MGEASLGVVGSLLRLAWPHEDVWHGEHGSYGQDLVGTPVEGLNPKAPDTTYLAVRQVMDSARRQRRIPQQQWIRSCCVLLANSENLRLGKQKLDA